MLLFSVDTMNIILLTVFGIIAASVLEDIITDTAENVRRWKED